MSMRRWGFARLAAIGAALLSLVAGVLDTRLPALASASDPELVQAFGSARSHGSPPPPPTDPVAGIVATPSGQGYWLPTADGAVLTFGDARSFGSMSGARLNKAVVGMAAMPSGNGYWLAASDGGVFSFGDADFFGSTGDIALNQPIVAIARTPSGDGYWFTAADGGVFTFGDAKFFGSAGDVRLQKPIVAMAPTPSGRGYWLAAADGGIFTFGDAEFFGSSGDVALNQPIVGIAATPIGDGYTLVAADGGVFTFGGSRFFGSMASTMPARSSAVGIAATPAGDGYWIAAGPDAVRIAVGGDVHGERRVRALLDAGGNPLELIADPMQTADLSIVNLETPVANAPGSPQQKQYVFLAPPSLVQALAAGGVDVVSLANNHALDHGRAALLESIDHSRRAGLQVVGAGVNATEAFRPAFVRAQGRTVAVIGLSRVVPPGWAATASTPGVASAYAESTAVRAVSDAARQADYVVVAIHWGVEMSRCPDGQILRLARVLRDAGADVVSGAHPHVVQGARREGSSLVAYSLGNFVWYHSDPPSDVTAVLDVTLSRGAVEDWRLRPARIDGSGRPVLLTGAAADSAAADTASLAPGAGRCPG